MNRARALFLWLACLLVFGQQGLALHQLSHAIEDSRYGQRQQHDDQHDGDEHRVCDQCAAYAPLGSAAASAPFDFPLQSAVGQDPLATRQFHFHPRPLAAYQSRAPPAFLI